MPRRADPNRLPALLLHRASGQGRVRIAGRYVYVGKFGTDAARQRYAEVLQQHFSAAAQAAVVQPEPATAPLARLVTVNDLCLRFVTERIPLYLTSEGKPSAERDCFRGVIRLLHQRFGELPVDNFGPLCLRQIRDDMVKKGWSRNFINKQIRRLRYIFRFGISWEIVDPSVAEKLKSVPALGPLESSAPEYPARKSVPDKDQRKVRELLSPAYRDIFDLLRLTGARPGEILRLTVESIQQEGDVWHADFERHKTSKFGKSRTLFFNRSAQAILLRYMDAAADTGRLFSVERSTFSNAVKRACQRAGVPAFVPHQLRHTVATKLSDDLGTECAQRLLGHATRAMAEHYSRAATKKAKKAVRHLDRVMKEKSPNPA